jgi:GR25 family glycosyltransferase involved in LPS biosynthesis
MKITYKLFHLDDAIDREQTATDANSILSSMFDELDTYPVNLMIDGASSDFLKNNPGFNPIFNFKIGELGCWASNFLAWKKFIESDYDALLICEDDAILSENFSEQFYEMVKELPDDWDFFSVFCHENQYERYSPSLRIGEKISIAYQDWSTLCYMISKSGAEKALTMVEEGFHQPIDWFIFRNQEIFNVFTPHPIYAKLVLLSGAETTIHNVDIRIGID